MVIYIEIALLAVVLGYLAYWRLWFLRDPERKIPVGKDNIICPADGKVLKIIKYDKKKVKVNKGLLGKVITFADDVADKGYIVSIFMNPMNVHVNRAPISGEVIYQKHSDGKFHTAMNFAKSFIENEKNEITIKDGKFKIKMIQVAGLFAQRVISYVKKGDNVKNGERIGLINLGSQVTTILPSNVKITVKEGDKVKAGSSIIAKRKR